MSQRATKGPTVEFVSLRKTSLPQRCAKSVVAEGLDSPLITSSPAPRPGLAMAGLPVRVRHLMAVASASAARRDRIVQSEMA